MFLTNIEPKRAPLDFKRASHDRFRKKASFQIKQKQTGEGKA